VITSVCPRGLWPLTRWEKLTWAVWIALLAGMCGRAFLMPNSRTVYNIWSSSSMLWWSGGELYQPHRPASVPPGFRYSPTFAILTTPFAWFPDAVGGVLWRCCCTILFAGAVSWWIRAVLPWRLSRDQAAQLFLLMLPLSVQSMSNAQANVPVITCLLATVAAIKERRWTWAAVFIAVAFGMKVYPLALGLVLVVLYPRQLGWRVPLAILAWLALPLLTQNTDRVVDQYQKWYTCVKEDDRSAIMWDQMYRDAWLLLRLAKVPVSREAYEIFEAFSGLAVAGLCWHRQRAGWPEKESLNGALALTCTWMLILGPASESCTYILLAPVLAASLVKALNESGGSWRRHLLYASCAFFLVAVCLGTLPGAALWHSWGLHPIGGLLYMAYLLTEPRPRLDAAVARMPLASAA
jgi:alpha-1,2-mannosyltransferase